MASEIRVDKINSLSGVGTVTLSPTGVDIAGITTVATLKATTGIVTTLTATTGIVTTLTANTVTSLGAVSGTTGTFSGAITGSSGGNFSGNINLSGANITLQDSGSSSDDRLVLGAGSDLSIYHDGSDSYIKHNGTGNFYVQTSESSVEDLYLQAGNDIYLRPQTGENGIKVIGDGAVELYNDNTKRLSTTGNGVDIFGNGTTNNYFKLVNSSGTSNASHHMTLDTYGAGSGGNYWSDLKIDASNIQLNTYTGNRATLSNTALTFASGVNIVMASGNGIDFAAETPSGSGSANTILDDYEEGTFTLTMTPVTSGSISMTTTLDSLRYTKIGNLVTIHGRVRIQSVSSPVGGIQIGGLPFASITSSSNSQDGYQHFAVNSHGVNFHDSTVQIFGEMSPGATTAGLFSMFDNGNWAMMDAASLYGNQNEYFGFSFFYHTAS